MYGVRKITLDHKGFRFGSYYNIIIFVKENSGQF